MIAMMGTPTPALTPIAALAPDERPEEPGSVVVVAEAEVGDAPATASTGDERAAAEAEAVGLVVMTRFLIVGSCAAAATLQESSDVGQDFLVYVGV